MTTSTRARPESLAFIRHLDRFPADLRDIRRLQRKFRLTVPEAARALSFWEERERIRKVEAERR